MEPLVPWLLLTIAGLIVACAVMHSRLRQVESTTRGQQSIIADELRDAEQALLSALERVRRMDSELAARESRLAGAPWEPVASASAPQPAGPDDPEAGGSGVLPTAPAALLAGADASHVADACEHTNRRAEGGASGISAPLLPAARSGSRGAALQRAHWRDRALQLSRGGASPRQIAQELELPVGEVELVLALER